MNESIVREAINEHREQLGRLIDALLNERDALESMRSRLCAALGLPADSEPETVAEAVEARRVVVPDSEARDCGNCRSYQAGAANIRCDECDGDLIPGWEPRIRANQGGAEHGNG